MNLGQGAVPLQGIDARGINDFVDFPYRQEVESQVNQLLEGI